MPRKMWSRVDNQVNEFGKVEAELRDDSDVAILKIFEISNFKGLGIV